MHFQKFLAVASLRLVSTSVLAYQYNVYVSDGHGGTTPSEPGYFRDLVLSNISECS